MHCFSVVVLTWKTLDEGSATPDVVISCCFKVGFSAWAYVLLWT